MMCLSITNIQTDSKPNPLKVQYSRYLLSFHFKFDNVETAINTIKNLFFFINWPEFLAVP